MAPVRSVLLRGPGGTGAMRLGATVPREEGLAQSSRCDAAFRFGDLEYFSGLARWSNDRKKGEYRSPVLFHLHSPQYGSPPSFRRHLQRTSPVEQAQRPSAHCATGKGPPRIAGR